MIGGVHVPGSISVVCPQYALRKSKPSMALQITRAVLHCLLHSNTCSFLWLHMEPLFESIFVCSRTLAPISGHDQRQGCVCPILNRSATPLAAPKYDVPVNRFLHPLVWLYREAPGSHGHLSVGCKARLDVGYCLGSRGGRGYFWKGCYWCFYDDLWRAEINVQAQWNSLEIMWW